MKSKTNCLNEQIEQHRKHVLTNKLTGNFGHKNTAKNWHKKTATNRSPFPQILLINKS